MIKENQSREPGRSSANFHLLLVSVLAGLIGVGAGFIAYLLYNLIAFFTNLFFYQRLSFDSVSPDQNQLGVLVVVVPVIGGLIVGLMAKYGSPKIRGHGIPEAMEAELVNRSRIAPRVAILLMHDTSIMTEKLARRGLRVPQDYEADVLQQVAVADVMTREVPTIKADMRVGELADRIARHDPLLTQHQALPILDTEDHLVGIITRGDVLRALDNGEQEKTVLEAGSDTLVTAYPEESVHEAISQMPEYNIGRLPVVSRDDPQRLIGYLGRSSVMQAWSQRLEEEARREPGWIIHFRAAAKTQSATHAR